MLFDICWFYNRSNTWYICIRQPSWNLSSLEPERIRNIISRWQTFLFGWLVHVFHATNGRYIIAIQDFNSRLTIWTLIWNTCTLARIKEAAPSAVLFLPLLHIRDFNRFLEKFFKHLETRNSILETRNTILETRNSKLDSRKYRGSRIEFRVETVNLHLTGTVFFWLDKQMQ